MMEWNESTYGSFEERERRGQRVTYRLRPPPPPPWFNRFQRIIWRVQRLVLGDNHRRKTRRGERHESRDRS
jgi:hypothetical protein